MPDVIGWILDPAADKNDLPPALAGVLGSLVVVRRTHHQLLEELLIELSLLETLLFDAVAAEVEARSGAVESSSVVELSAGIAQRLTIIMILIAGMFNEEAEQERREERRKLDGFTRMVSHEMRTPIGAAFTAARMLQEMRDELPPDEKQRMLEVVGRGLTRSIHLLESVTSLALAREEGRDPSRLQGLRTVVEDVLAEVGAEADAAGVRLEIAGSLPNAQVDGRRLELILLNLVQNAVKYHDPTKEDRWVRVEVQRDAESFGWLVQVEDNGLGIGREEQEKVFRRFYRAHADLAGGTGLGLVIAREAAEQLGGEIGLESVPGVGSTFTFRVPDEEREGGEEGS